MLLEIKIMIEKEEIIIILKLILLNIVRKIVFTIQKVNPKKNLIIILGHFKNLNKKNKIIVIFLILNHKMNYIKKLKNQNKSLAVRLKKKFYIIK